MFFLIFQTKQNKRILGRKSAEICVYLREKKYKNSLYLGKLENVYRSKTILCVFVRICVHREGKREKKSALRCIEISLPNFKTSLK